ncbi:MAG: DUF11 domain-containing protein [Candidatus Levybacteria bacterium]|nr:DUF11 domain-containing protein [Candidatus Levybacteria bacterium]
MNKTIAITSALILGSIVTVPAFASGNVTPTPTQAVLSTTNNNTGGYGTTTCEPTYGGGTNCVTTKILIDKSVKNPQSGQFVDNLTINDPKYAPNDTVSFQLKVTNTSDQALSNVSVTDVLPSHLTYVSGISGGSYDNSTKTLTFNAGDFKVNESKTFTLNAKIAQASDLPADQGILCETNQSFVAVNNVQNQDNAQVCIQKPTLGTTSTMTKGGQVVYPSPNAKATPKTGAEMLALFALIPSSIGGLILRRKTS